MKTKDRILLAARLLFNEEGERNVGMVDIAAATDISPGNLYYHFRGKEELIPALFDQFESRMMSLLQEPCEELEGFQGCWAYLFNLLNLIKEYRCVYTDINDVIARDTSLSRRFARLLAVKQRVAEALCQLLREWNMVIMSDSDKVTLASQLALFLGTWINHTSLLRPQREVEPQQGVLEFMSLLLPYSSDKEIYMQCCLELFQSTTGETSL